MVRRLTPSASFEGQALSVRFALPLAVSLSPQVASNGLPEGAHPGGPPYSNGTSALRDGWMLFQSAQLNPPMPGQEHMNSYLEYEFVFERRVQVTS